ncbi:MAG: hypothetical protein K0M56_10830 [Kaistella sp.]|nr:hypothetical protein [Kaistella sp.]
MLELLLILLGLNFTNTTATLNDTGSTTPVIEITNPPVNQNPIDTGGETQPIPPKR